MPGPDGRGERACSGPRRAEHHPDRGELIFGLEHQVVVLPRVGVATKLGAVLGECVHERRRRGDRVPRGDRRPRVHAAERRRGVAVDEHRSLGRVHRLDPAGQRMVEVLGREVVSETERQLVGRAKLVLAGELLGEQLRDDVHIEAEHRDQRARAGDVLHEDALARPAKRVVAHLRERHAEVGHVLADQCSVERPRRVVHGVAAAHHLRDIALVCLPVHRHHHVVPAGARDMTVLVDPDLVPGRQSLDVRRKEVLAGDRNAHPEDGAHQQVVGARGAGAVDVGELQREVIDFGALCGLRLGSHAHVATGTGVDSASGIASSNFCMSHAAVGHRSAQRPQWTQRSSSLTITRPVWGSAAET